MNSVIKNTLILLLIAIGQGLIGYTFNIKQPDYFIATCTGIISLTLYQKYHYE